MNDITYTALRPDLAPALEQLELSVFTSIVPEDLYNEAELRKLAEVFPEGNFVAFDGDRPIGMGLGILVEFDFDHPDHAIGDILGDDGVTNHHPDNDWYYGTDISVYPEYRGRGIGKHLYELRKEVVQKLGKKGIVAGGVIPGYANHIEDMTALEYINTVSAGELHDPTLSFQIANGFEALGVIPDYVKDESVGNNASLIVWRNPDLAISRPLDSASAAS